MDAVNDQFFFWYDRGFTERRTGFYHIPVPSSAIYSIFIFLFGGTLNVPAAEFLQESFSESASGIDYLPLPLAPQCLHLSSIQPFEAFGGNRDCMFPYRESEHPLEPVSVVDIGSR